jgi:DNA recombination protein RmuC
MREQPQIQSRSADQDLLANGVALGAAYEVLSSYPGKIVSMDGVTVIVLIGGLLAGLLLGSIAGWMIARARQYADSAHTQMLIAQSHGEAATARAEAAHARTEAAQARSDIAEARSEAAAAQADAAQVSAEVARAIAQRDAALDRVREISADRESMINHFRVLSAQTLDRQGQAADAQAEIRLKATEQLMSPVRESLERFNSRLTEVEKERAAMSAELRSQVSYVQQTGETLRRETAALVNALRKPQIRGSWGETQLKRVAELAGMIERCDFDLQYTTKDDDRVLRPDMRVNLSEGKHVFVDAKVPLNSFLQGRSSRTLRAQRSDTYRSALLQAILEGGRDA